MSAPHLPAESTGARSGRWRPLMRLGLALASLGLALVLVETVAGWILRRREAQSPAAPEAPPTGPWASALARDLAAYKARCAPRSMIRYFPYSGWVMRPFQSETLNSSDDGVRRTVFPGDGASAARLPTSASSTRPTTGYVFRIYMLGGSTLLGHDAPDDRTIPSEVGRRLLNTPGLNGRTLDIVNFGTSAYSSTQEVIRFFYEYQRSFATHGRPDLVVFYDGANEIWAAGVKGTPGLHDAYDRMVLRFDDLPRFFFLKLSETLAARSSTVQLMSDLSRQAQRAAPREEKLDRERGVAQADIYGRSVEAVAALGRHAGFETLHVLQPLVFTQSRAHPIDVQRKEFQTRVLPEVAAAWRHGYPPLAALAKSHPQVVDLSDALDGLDVPVFTDYCHVTPHGNAAVAGKLAAQIQRRFLK